MPDPAFKRGFQARFGLPCAHRFARDGPTQPATRGIRERIEEQHFARSRYDSLDKRFLLLAAIIADNPGVDDVGSAVRLVAKFPLIQVKRGALKLYGLELSIGMCHQNVRDTIGFGKALFQRDTRARKLLAQPARQHNLAAHMAHRFRLGTPGAFALLVREMKLRLLLWPATRVYSATTIGAMQGLLTRPALRLFKRRLTGDHQHVSGTIRDQHNLLFSMTVQFLVILFYVTDYRASCKGCARIAIYSYCSAVSNFKPSRLSF